MTNLSYFIQTHAGSSASTAINQGQSLLMSNVSKQAYISGIDDDFLIAAIVTIIGLIPTIILQSKKKSEPIKNTEHYEIG
jgi:DHA2 family multidrug resistance protein